MGTNKGNAPATLPHITGASTEKDNQTALDDSITGNTRPLSRDASAQRFIAESWIEANARVWSWITGKAQAFAADGKHFSMQQLLAMARYSGEVEYSKQDPVFKVNNTTIPALSRLLDEQLPEVAGWHEKRHSKCDWAFGGSQVVEE